MINIELSNEQVIERVQKSCAEGSRVNAQVIHYLAIIEERGIHREMACSSMFDFCVRRLKMSEGEAFRRINAARLVRKFPEILERIANNEIHLSSLVLLREFLTEDNHRELLTAVARLSKREVKALLAERFGVHEPTFKIFIQANPALWKKLQEALDLSRHENPSADLTIAFDRSLDAYIAEMRRTKRAATDRPRAAPKEPVKANTIPAAVRREVFARDGERCTFVEASGERCPATGFLELDHVIPRARGGKNQTENLRVRCRQHNLQHAKHSFGEELITERRDLRQRKSKR